MGWWITLGVLILLGLIPLGASVKYNADGPLVKIIAGPVRVKVFPLPKKEKKPNPKAEAKKAKKEAEKKAKKEADKKAKAEAKDKTASEKAMRPLVEEEKGGSWTDFLPLVKVVLKFLNGFRKKLRINRLELKLIMAADDPCDLAVNYGKAWAALGNLLPQLEKVFVIKKRDLEVECDFTASQTLVIARLDLTITLGRLLGLVFALIFRAAVKFIQIMIKRKGGAKQ